MADERKLNGSPSINKDYYYYYYYYLSDQFCVCAFAPIVQAVKHETLTQCWANAGPLSTALS